jgi:hypothetical protein
MPGSRTDSEAIAGFGPGSGGRRQRAFYGSLKRAHMRLYGGVRAFVNRAPRQGYAMSMGECSSCADASATSRRLCGRADLAFACNRPDMQRVKGPLRLDRSHSALMGMPRALRRARDAPQASNKRWRSPCTHVLQATSRRQAASLNATAMHVRLSPPARPGEELRVECAILKVRPFRPQPRSTGVRKHCAVGTVRRERVGTVFDRAATAPVT